MHPPILRFAFLIPVAVVLASCAGSAGPIHEAAAQICDGSPVEGVARYEGEGPHPITIVAAMEDASLSHPRVPRPWVPSNLAEMELVACIGAPRTEHVETCDYINGPSIVRLRQAVTVRLLAAETGGLVASSNFSGSEPRDCYFQESANTTSIVGGEVDLDVFGQYAVADTQPPAQVSMASWLKGFVEAPARQAGPAPTDVVPPCGVVTSTEPAGDGYARVIVRMDGTGEDVAIITNYPINLALGDHIELAYAAGLTLYKGTCP